MPDIYQTLEKSLALFFQPWKAIQAKYEELETIDVSACIKQGLFYSLIGSFCFILANAVSSNTRIFQSFFFLIFHLFFSLLISYVFYLFCLSVFYLMLSIFFGLQDWKRLISIYLFSDFIFILLLPLSIICKLLGYYSASVFSVIAFVFYAVNIVLKIRTLALVSKINNFRSLFLLLIPSVLILICLITSIIYFLFYFGRMLS